MKFIGLLVSIFTGFLSGNTYANCRHVLNNPQSSFDQHGREIIVSVVAILVDSEGRKLMLKRSQNDRSFPNTWGFPGGGVDQGETLEAAVLREVWEETGLRVKIIRPLPTQNSILQARNRTYEIHPFIVEVEANSDTAIRLSHEHQEFKWVAQIEGSELNFAGDVSRRLFEDL